MTCSEPRERKREAPVTQELGTFGSLVWTVVTQETHR